MISCICPGCGSKFSAKDRLAGRTMKCPTCGTPLRVPTLAASPAASPPDPAGPEAAEPHVHEVQSAPLPPLGHPTRFDRRCRYLICDDVAWRPSGRTTAAAGCSPPISASSAPR